MDHGPGRRSVTIRRATSFAALGAAVALGAAACGGSSGGGSSSAPPAAATAVGTAAAPTAAASAAASTTTVSLATSKLGQILVDSKGNTLYLYTPDTGTMSNCSGGCATEWPPLLSAAKPTAGAGVDASKLGLTTRSDGSHEVTYNGHPLYTYAADTAAGQVNGEEVGGSWYVVSAAGAKIEPGDDSSSSGSSGSSSYGGSHY